MTLAVRLPRETVRSSAAVLAAEGARERRTAFLFALPCVAFVGVSVVAPCLWLLWQSAFGLAGKLSLENYARILKGESYLRSFEVTFEVSFETVAACIVIGVPFTAFLSGLPPRQSRLLLVAVLLPFWTSLLVRAYAWIVLLQRTGVVNTVLQRVGLTDEPLSLVFNTFGAVLGMTHIMLPLFILPVLGAMRRIDGALIRAAASLGASRWQALRLVFLPLALPGIAAGAMLVFVSCIGFYVTPAILGGGKVYMVSMRIERSLANYANWGAASALGVLLLLAVAGLLVVGFAVSRLARRWT